MIRTEKGKSEIKIQKQNEEEKALVQTHTHVIRLETEE